MTLRVQDLNISGYVNLLIVFVYRKVIRISYYFTLPYTMYKVTPIFRDVEVTPDFPFYRMDPVSQNVQQNIKNNQDSQSRAQNAHGGNPSKQQKKVGVFRTFVIVVLEGFARLRPVEPRSSRTKADKGA